MTTHTFMHDHDTSPTTRVGRRALRPGAVLAAGVLAAGLSAVAPPAPAAAAAPLACINTLYLTDNVTGNIDQVDLTSGAIAPAPVFVTPPAAGTNPNQLGVGADGAVAILGTPTSIIRYVPGASPAGEITVTPKAAGAGAGTMGAVNPLTGLYYYGAFSGTTVNIYVYDPTTNNALPGPVASVTTVNPPGANGDMAFDKTGRLYLVAGSTSEAALYVAQGAVPSSGTGATLTSREISRGATTATTNGIAFGSDGFLYLGGTTVLQKTNPITGAPTGTSFPLNGVTSTDLGTCANPSTARTVTGFDGPRDQPTDKVRIVVDGGSYGPHGSTPDFPVSTSGDDGGEIPSEPGLIIPGETYTVRQEPVGSTNLTVYNTTWTCTDENGVVVSSGTGNTASFTAPTGTVGANVDCAFVNVLPPPVAVPDAATGTFDDPVVLPGSTNDTPGNGAIVPDQTVFTDPAATDGGKRLTTPDGVWTAGTDGRLTFTPAPGFTGTATTGYRITDDNGLTSTSTATATVRPGPSAAPDTAATTQGASVQLPVLGNDAPGQNADGSPGTMPRASVLFPTSGQPAGAIVSADRRRIEVPGEGVYTVNQTTGVVTFAPAPTFVGPVTTPVAYGFTDSLGSPASSTITVTVTAVAPTAVNDATTTPFDTPVTLNVVGNDVAGPGGVIVPTATVFTDPAATDGGKTLVTTQGTWRVTPAGPVEFTPAAGFSGIATTPYRITDANGQQSTATISVTVRPGPAATPDTASTTQNVDVSFPILDDDVPGTRADGSAGSFDPASLRFTVTPGLPAGSVVSGGGRVLTVPGQGVYTFDAGTEDVTFDPESQFTGAATPVTYTVTDSSGNDASTTITVTVTAVTPVAIGDAAKTPGATPVVIDILANDEPGAVTVPLVPGSVVFTSVSATGGGKTLVRPGEGTWTVRPDGTVRFVPEPGWEGAATPVEYRVADQNGTTTTAQITVEVGSGAIAAPDAAVTRQNTPVELDLLDDDFASDLGNPCDAGETNVPAGCDTGVFVPASVVFPDAGQPSGAVVSNAGRTIDVSGEGVYTIDQTTGAVTFTPEAAFTGTAASVVYSATDSHGAVVSSTVTVTVTAVTPTAQDDRASTPYGVPVTFDLLGNDSAGDPSAPLVPADTLFVPVFEDGITLSGEGDILTIDGQGTFVIDDAGSVVFTPVDGFTGTTTSVAYFIFDANGTAAEARIQVTVRSAPSASPDVESTPQNVPVTLDVLANDTAGQRADGTPGEFDPASVVFPASGQPVGATIGAGGKTLSVPNEGAYAIGADGAVTFTPLPAFRGTASPVTYAVTDSSGNSASSTVTITVAGVDPIARDNTATTRPGVPIVIDVIGDDSRGTDGAAFDPASLRIVNAAGDLVTELSVAGEGVWTVVDGRIVFAPAPGFTGTTTPITYSVADVNGTRVTATVTVTVSAAAAVTGGTALPTTGGSVPWLPLGAGLLLLLAGIVILIRRRSA